MIGGDRRSPRWPAGATGSSLPSRPDRRWPTIYLSGTLNGNAIAAAAGLATLDVPSRRTARACSRSAASSRGDSPSATQSAVPPGSMQLGRQPSASCVSGWKAMLRPQSQLRGQRPCRGGRCSGSSCSSRDRVRPSGAADVRVDGARRRPDRDRLLRLRGNARSGQRIAEHQRLGAISRRMSQWSRGSSATGSGPAPKLAASCSRAEVTKVELLRLTLLRLRCSVSPRTSVQALRARPLEPLTRAVSKRLRAAAIVLPMRRGASSSIAGIRRVARTRAWW